MEAVVERSNMLCAEERVVANEGAPGVDGLPVAELKPWLKVHWAKVRQALLAVEYMPAAVRKVEIPNREGGGKLVPGLVIEGGTERGMLSVNVGTETAALVIGRSPDDSAVVLSTGQNKPSVRVLGSDGKAVWTAP
jgi:hypothetical protein